MATVATTNKNQLTIKNSLIKRTFDLSASFLGLILTSGIILIAWLIASIETKSNGFFLQKRIGQYGKVFSVIKIKTMNNRHNIDSTVTTLNDNRITKSGLFFRRTNIDELPQLINVLLGHMSFVGPRPDVPGYADKLSKEDNIILSLRPGITGPATLKYRDEETLLACKEYPEKYNIDVIYPDKVQINKDYIKNYSFSSDLQYIFQTISH